MTNASELVRVALGSVLVGLADRRENYRVSAGLNDGPRIAAIDVVGGQLSDAGANDLARTSGDADQGTCSTTVGHEPRFLPKCVGYGDSRTA